MRAQSRVLQAKGDLPNDLRTIILRRRCLMIVILIFIGFVFVGDVAAVLIASLVEPISKFASLLVFLALFVAVFWVAWLLAVQVTERHFLKQR